MVLSKTDSLALIHKRLDAVAEALALVDGQKATRTALQDDLAKACIAANALIAKDDTTPVKLATQRAAIDLLKAKVERADKAILVSEEAVVIAGERAAQLVYAFKMATIAAYYADMEEKTKAFFDSRDMDRLKQIAGTSYAGRQIHAHPEFHFSVATLSHRQSDIDEARRMPLCFDNLEATAKGLNVEIDIPHQWLEEPTKAPASAEVTAGNKLGALA